MYVHANTARIRARRACYDVEGSHITRFDASGCRADAELKQRRDKEPHRPQAYLIAVGPHGASLSYGNAVKLVQNV